MANINLSSGERYTFAKLQGTSVITEGTDHAQSIQYIRNDLYVTSSLSELVVKSGAGTGNSITKIQTVGTGNPILQLAVAGSPNWSIGIDNNDAAKLKINNATSLASPTTLAMTIDTNKTASFAGGVVITGSLSLPNRATFRVTGSSITGISATTTITSTQGAVVDYNQGNYYDNTTGIFTVPNDGMYHVYLNCRVQVAGSQQVIVYKNNTNPMLMWEAANNTGAVHFGVSSILKLAVGDTLRAKVTVGTVQFDSNDSWGAAFIG